MLLLNDPSSRSTDRKFLIPRVLLGSIMQMEALRRNLGLLLQDGCSGFSQCDVGLKRRWNVEGSIFQAGRQRRAVLDGLRASMFPAQHEP
jgi:hypothetical protein